MSWESVSPIVKTTPRIQASTYVNKDEVPRIRLTFSDSFLNDLGRPVKADVQLGFFGSVCKMRLLFHDAGQFDIIAYEKGGGRIWGVPSRDPIPAQNCEAEKCDVESMPTAATVTSRGDAALEVIAVLPVEAWRKQLEAAKPLAVPTAPKVTTGSGAPALVVTTKAIDAVEYLRKRGESARRVGSRIEVDGEFLPPNRVLALVNHHRAKSQLPPLDIDGIH